MSQQVLIYPNFDVPFILVTDASGVAIGAVLIQDTGQDEHPVAYTY